MSDFDPQEWDRCCTRCHQTLNWDGDLPETEDDAICHDCAWKELEALRAKLAKLEPAARVVYRNMKGTCDYAAKEGDPPCQGPSFAGFMHGMCNAHAEELEAPVGALTDQTMLNNLKEALLTPIDHTKLVRPTANLDVAEPHVPIPEEGSPKCLKCGEPLSFTERAAEEIAFARMMEVTQTVIACPDCGCRMVIFPKGDVKHEMVEDGLVVHAPSEGFFIALGPTETP